MLNLLRPPWSQVLKWEVVSARKGILLFHVGIDIFVLAYEVSQMLRMLIIRLGVFTNICEGHVFS